MMDSFDRRVGLAAAIVCAVTLQMTVLAGGALAQDKGAGEGNASADPSQTTPAVQAVQDVALARQLVIYGQRTGSAEPMIAAARILLETPTQPASWEPQHQDSGDAASNGADADKESAPELSVLEVLWSAREMAGDDEHMIAVIEQLEGSMEKGRMGGPTTHYDRVEAYTTDVYSDITFYAGETAMINVIGDGDTDLDCYVYDEGGHLIDSDEDYTDVCNLIWTPRWTGPFELQIKNLGSVWNAYSITTN